MLALTCPISSPQKTRTSIKIFSEPMPNSNERSVQIIGTESQISECVEYFLEEISKVVCRAPGGGGWGCKAFSFLKEPCLSLLFSFRRSRGSQFICTSRLLMPMGTCFLRLEISCLVEGAGPSEGAETEMVEEEEEEEEGYEELVYL